jgi:hypothetical protein
MAALAAALCWAVMPFADRHWCWVAAVAGCLAEPVMGYGLPGVVHHHVLLAVVATMEAGWAARIIRGSSGGIPLGAWAAAGVWLSPESMPLSLMAICAVWFAYFIAGRGRAAQNLATSLAETGITLFAVVTAAWLADPPAALWAAEPDRISVIFVTLAAGMALCGGAAAAGLPRIAVAAFGAGLAALWLGAFPVVLRGTYGVLPPDVAHQFLDGINEMKPIHSAGVAADNLGLAAIGTAALAVIGLWRRARVVLYAAACGAAAILAGMEHVRFSAYAAVFGAALLPIGLTFLGSSRWRPAVLLLGLAGPHLSGAIAPSSAATPHPKICRMTGVDGLLAPYAGQVVMANVNYTPDLLWRTGVLTVGSLYHRNPAAFLRLEAAWASPPGQTMPAAVAATGARLLLVCPGEAAPGPAATLQAALQAGQTPPWLHPVAALPDGGFVLYAVNSGDR